MSPVSETSISLLASTLPKTTSAKIMAAALFLAIAAAILRYASPVRLTRVLLAAIHDAESTYFDALEAGLVSASHAEQLSALQLKVSIFYELTLRTSLSHLEGVSAFFRGRTFTVLHCICEVHRFETHIKILKEEQLRDPVPTAVRAISLRRRTQATRSMKCCGC